MARAEDGLLVLEPPLALRLGWLHPWARVVVVEEGVAAAAVVAVGDIAPSECSEIHICNAR